jgi:pentatricopeptide repeat protein
MFLQIHRQNTVCLLDLLIPSLLHRARSFTTHPGSSKRATQQPMLKNDPLLQSQIRDKILAQTANRSSLPNSEKNQINDALGHVRRALINRDVFAALEHWQYLENLRREPCSKGDLYRIPESYYKDLTGLICSHLYGMSSTGELDPEAKTVVERFAFETATQYSDSEALAAYLLFLIKQNRPQDVIDLYQTFIKSVGLTTSQPPEPTSSDEGLVLSDDDAHSELKDLGRISVLLAAMTAHTMTSSFKSVFDTYQATDIRVRKDRRNKFLQHLEYNPTLHAEVQKCFKRLQIADLVARPPSLSKHIMNLSHPDTAPILERLYASIMDGIRASDHYLAAQPTEVSNTRLVSLTPVGWTSFQTAFIRCKRTDLAAKLWSDLSDLKVHPGVTMWNALLDTYVDLRDLSRVMDAWRTMRREGIQPDALSYRALISILFGNRRPEEAMRNFAEYQRLLKDHSDHAIDVYNTVIRGLLSHNRIHEVNSLLAKMRLAGPTPDIVSYNTLLAYYARLNDFKALANVVTTMSAANISGDVVTFSTILTALLQVGKEDAPTTILNLMRKQGIQPNVRTYRAIIDHQMRAQTQESLQAALLMLDKMEQDANIKPNEEIYTSILTGLYRDDWLNYQKADELRKRIVLRMRKMQIKFGRRTYHILMKACLKSSDPSGYRDALAIIEEMQRQGTPRNHGTWFLLLTGLMGLGKWDVAQEMVSRMFLSGHEPSESIRALVREINSHQAV